MTEKGTPETRKRNSDDIPAGTLLTKEFGQGGSKRQKITLSCNECRRRKIKCGHEKPICLNCQKRGSDTTCTYARSPWIDIIAAESKVYQEIDALKRENDDLMEQVAAIKSELILVYKKNHNSINSSDDDILSGGNANFMYDTELETTDTGSWLSNTHRAATAESNSSISSTTDETTNSNAERIPKFSKYEYHFLKDTTEIPLRNRVKRILATDVQLIEFQSYADVETPRVLTSLRCGNDAFYKTFFLNQLVGVLPRFDVMEFHLGYYFRTNYHKQMPILSETLLVGSFHRIFNSQTGRIELDPTRELEDFIQLGIILLVLKIVSLYKDTLLTDGMNVFLRNAYIAFELGEIKTRASIATLQALLLMTSFRLFSHKVSDMELFFSTELCRDMAIALGIHKNTEIIYEHKSKEEKQVLQNIKVMLSRGW